MPPLRAHPDRCAPRPAIATVALAVLTITFAGCVSMGRSAKPVPLDVVRPGVRGGESGLEIWSWVVVGSRGVTPMPVVDPAPAGPLPPKPSANQPADQPPLRYTPGVIDPREDIGVLLARHAEQPVPVADDVRDAWRQAGLRLVVVPVDELASIHAAARTIGRAQRQWLGQVPGWLDIVSGPAFASRVVRIRSGLVPLGAGRLRLLLRSWIEPAATLDGRPALAVELLPQHAQRRPREPVQLAPALPGSTLIADGMIFESLRASLTLAHDQALLIVPESPDAVWGPPERPEHDAPPAGAQGPPIPAAPTLGEAMLTDAIPGSPPGARAIVILIPRLPDDYHLLGR